MGRIPDNILTKEIEMRERSNNLSMVTASISVAASLITVFAMLITIVCATYARSQSLIAANRAERSAYYSEVAKESVSKSNDLVSTVLTLRTEKVLGEARKVLESPFLKEVEMAVDYLNKMP